MPLRLPNLDDRRYNDLIADALARIPVYSPEWTNHNPSDPGITLIELFGYLTDMLLYRLNRVTDNNTRKFLKLLAGQEPSADSDLRQEIRMAVLGVRERYRAVTKDDYEFLSTESYNQWLIGNSQSSFDKWLAEHSMPSIQLASIHPVARAHCVPQRNLDAGTEAGRLQPKPGHVSVVIVPAPQKPNPNPPPAGAAEPPGSSSPQPSPDQIATLFSYLDARRIVTTRLHVTGPFYAHITAQLVIARNSDAVDEHVTDPIKKSLENLLNPLPSDNGEGWPFGRDVFVSEVYETLEKIPGIDFITDVMLNGVPCAQDDSKCVVANPIWHPEGNLVGLRIEEHHLPVFDHAEIVIAANAAFVAVNLSISAGARANTDQALLKRLIKSAVRNKFHPALGGPGPANSDATKIFVSEIEAAIGLVAGIRDLQPLGVDCVPSNILQEDQDRGRFIQVEAGRVVDWRVAIQLS